MGIFGRTNGPGGHPFDRLRAGSHFPEGLGIFDIPLPIEGEEGGPLPRPFAESILSEAEGLRVTEGNGEVR